MASQCCSLCGMLLLCSDLRVLLCCVGPAGAEVESVLFSMRRCNAVQGKQVYRVRSAQGRAGWLDLSGVQAAAPGCLHQQGQQGQLQPQVLVPMMGLRLEIFWPGEDAWFAGNITGFDPAGVSCPLAAECSGFDAGLVSRSHRGLLRWCLAKRSSMLMLPQHCCLQKI